jgi:protein SCO1/2
MSARAGSETLHNDMTLAARLARRCAVTVLLACLACFTPALAATAPLHGIIVSTIPASDTLVVHHDATGGMPSMTMLFRVSKGTAARVHAGDRITANADFGADPARLDDVHVIGRAPEVPSGPVLHNAPALEKGDVMPLTAFFDQDGRGFTFNDFRGQTVLLSFVYTRCQDPRMCPLISSNFHQLQQKLAGLPVHLVEITLDPAYDTPDVLKKYGERFGADASRWTLGTGPVGVVQEFASRFGIAVFDDPSRGLVHTDRTVVIDRNGAVVDLIDEAGWTADDVAAELRSVAALPSNPIARLDYELSKAAQAICGNSTPGAAGLVSLGLAFALFAGGTWLLVRIARKIFVEEP